MCKQLYGKLFVSALYVTFQEDELKGISLKTLSLNLSYLDNVMTTFIHKTVTYLQIEMPFAGFATNKNAKRSRPTATGCVKISMY